MKVKEMIGNRVIYCVYHGCNELASHWVGYTPVCKKHIPKLDNSEGM